MKKVDFFIVGEPKSGTTAMVNFLAQHPDIYISEDLEPRYFCKDLYGKESNLKKNGRGQFFTIRTLESYERLFEHADVNRLWGEKSVHYLISTTAAENIYKYNPEAKIIILLRKPVDFLKSLYSHYSLERIEIETPFNKALELEETRRKGLKIPKLAPTASLIFYSETIRYSKHIKRFYKYFNQKAVKVIFFEDFKKDNAGVYKEVLRFLGVDDDFVPKFRRVNVRRKFRFEFLFDLINYNTVYRGIMDRIPLRIRAGLSPWCHWIFFKEVKAVDDDWEISKKMKDKFDKIIEAEIKELTKLLEVDVRRKWAPDPNPSGSDGFTTK